MMVSGPSLMSASGQKQTFHAVAARSEGGTTVPSFGPREHRCGYAGALRIDNGISADRPHMLTG